MEEVDWCPVGSCAADVPDWVITPDAESAKKRSALVRAVIQNRHTEHLRNLLHSGWDVNEVLYMPDAGRMVTALHIAAQHGWTQGVQVLHDAGANFKGPYHLMDTPLQLALQNTACSVATIELLLKHGADPNLYSAYIPLFKAISQMFAQSEGIFQRERFTTIVQVLLDNGADPNLTRTLHPLSTALGKALDCLNNPQDREVNVALMKTLIQFGADVNCKEPLLHKMLGSFEMSVKVVFCAPILTIPHYIFLREHLDMYFQYGGNIHKDFKNIGTGLELAVKENCHSNSIRWLIRHGADISGLRFHHMIKALRDLPIRHFTYKTTLIMMQAGMRVPLGTSQHLFNFFQEGLSGAERDVIWNEMEKEEKFTRVKKQIQPEYLTKQMADLEELSDWSLQVYPEVPTSPDLEGEEAEIEKRKFILDQLCMVGEFLSQPQSLLWYSRRCVRENLVSLQPSVVNSLEIPYTMKPYLLCHEI